MRVCSAQSLLDGANVQAPGYSRAVLGLGHNLPSMCIINVDGEETKPAGSTSFGNMKEALVSQFSWSLMLLAGHAIHSMVGKVIESSSQNDQSCCTLHIVWARSNQSVFSLAS